MKKFIVLAATAALLSGVSFANAQTATPKVDKTQMNADTNAAFCLDIGGTKSCKYTTLANCQKDAKSNGTCMPNAKAGTTGSGMDKGAAGKGN
jgi:hypothetical protein